MVSFSVQSCALSKICVFAYRFKFPFTDMLTEDFCVIKNQLEMLVDKMRSTEEFDVTNAKNSILSLEKIKLAKTAYSLLYEISVQLNNIVSLSQLVNLTQGFIYLTSDLHTLYLKLYLNDFGALLGWKNALKAVAAICM